MMFKNLEVLLSHYLYLRQLQYKSYNPNLFSPKYDVGDDGRILQQPLIQITEMKTTHVEIKV